MTPTGPALLEELQDADGEPLGAWRQDPTGRAGLVRLVVQAANEWTPLVREASALDVARAVASLDGELADFHDSPLHLSPEPVARARRRLRDLLKAGALDRKDAQTAEMLEAFSLP